MNKRIQVGLVIGALVVLVTLALVRPPSEAVATDKLRVTASFYPLAYFAQQIGGDRVVVTNMTPAGAEPHDYEPTPSDIAALEKSDVVILNGAHLEAWGDKVPGMIGPHTVLVHAADGIADHTVDEGNGPMQDPHVWLSPQLASRMVDAIEASFEKADPSHAAEYETHAQSFKQQLSQLDKDYRSQLASCTSKDIITSHAAFGYLAAAYGLHQIPIAGLSPDEEPSPVELARISAYAKQNHISYIFFESLVSPRLSQTIANEVGAQTLVLDPIEGLTSDEVAAGDTYMTEMQKNLTRLTSALQCTR